MAVPTVADDDIDWLFDEEDRLPEPEAQDGALDLVPPGGAVPLAALFEPAPPQAVAATAVELQSAILASEPVSNTSIVLLDVAAGPGADSRP